MLYAKSRRYVNGFTTIAVTLICEDYSYSVNVKETHDDGYVYEYTVNFGCDANAAERYYRAM